MKSKKVTFADIAAYTGFQKQRSPAILMIRTPLPWRISRRSQTPLWRLIIRKIKWEGYWQAERRNLSASLFRTCTCIIIQKCSIRFLPLMRSTDISFLYLQEMQGRM